jgi:hypothetical protein
MSGKRSPARVRDRSGTESARGRRKGLTWPDAVWRIAKACAGGWGPTFRVCLTMVCAALACGLIAALALLLRGLG